MRNVFLYGHLKTAFGAKFRLNVKTPGEAIRLLNANFPGFEARLRKGYYELVAGPKRSSGDYLGLNDVEMGLGRNDFHIVPVVAGSKGGGAIKAVLGVALVGAAIFFSGGTLAAPLAGMGTSIGGGLGVTWGNIAGLGLMAGLAGISGMISPATKATTGTDAGQSFALAGPTNIDAQGYPVPLIIGEVITGGTPVSSGYDVEDIAIGA